MESKSAVPTNQQAQSPRSTNSLVTDEEQPLHQNNTRQHSSQEGELPNRRPLVMFVLLVTLLIVVIAMYSRLAYYITRPVKCSPNTIFHKTRKIVVKEKPDSPVAVKPKSAFLPSKRPVFSYTQTFAQPSADNLWNIPTKDKEQMFQAITQAYPELIPPSDSSKAGTLPNRHAQNILFMKDFDVHAETVAWSKTTYSSHQTESYGSMYDMWMKRRKMHYSSQLREYKANNPHPQGYISADLGITHYQFQLAIEAHSLTGNHNANGTDLKAIQQKEWNYLNERYHIDEYASNQLPICVLIPTFRNEFKHRFVWNLESVLMQNYSNFKVVIVDDNSPDQTSKVIARHLGHRKADPNKYFLVKSKRHNRSLVSFYYGAHKYCNYGEILMVIDGDDELIGRQTFKLLNAVYQKEKVYTLYSNFMWWYGDNSEKGTVPGNSMEYPQNTLHTQNYRHSNLHGYNHLRTMLSDLFLLTPNSSMVNKTGHFYEMITDNAVYFPALEMSCGRVRYLPEMLYWYSYNLTSNVVRSNKKDKYKEIKMQIDNKPKHECIEETIRRARKEVEKKEHGKKLSNKS